MFWAGEASDPSCRTAFIVNSNTCGQKLALVVDKKCEDAFGLRSQNVENLSRRGVILVGFKYVDNVPLPRKWEKMVDYVSNSPKKNILQRVCQQQAADGSARTSAAQSCGKPAVSRPLRAFLG